MPALGADMEDGTLVEWLKQPGDHVERGDIVAVVETQKGAIEIEIFETGTIDELLVEPGQKVPVGAVMAMVNGGAEAAISAPVPEPEPATPLPAPELQPPAAGAERLRISPAARRRGEALGIALDGVRGTGAEGAITLDDVERAAEQPRAAPRAAMREAIATAMARSKREIPHFYLGTTIDMTEALIWLERTNLDRPVSGRLLPGALLLKAVALALRETPQLNGFWRDGAVRPGDGIHVGWAVSLRGGGLIAPAIHDADGKSLDELMAALRDLVKRARGGGLRSSELADGTITVTSLGEQGVEEVYGVIYPPQLALVGLGKVVERPWAADGAVVVRRVLRATLSADHRAVDGHIGGLFLAALDRLLQEPEKL